MFGMGADSRILGIGASSPLHISNRLLGRIRPARADFPQLWPLTSAAFAVARPAAMMIQAQLMESAMKIEIEVTARLP